MNERDILLKVLDIINYQDNKEEFVNKFFSIIYFETIRQLQYELSDQDKELFGKELGNVKDENEQKNTILKYFPKKTFEDRITHVTSAQFSDYLNTIYPVLTDYKKEELTNFLNTLEKPQG
jgi:hypothetical protein